jgi:hypothetical protein
VAVVVGTAFEVERVSPGICKFFLTDNLMSRPRYGKPTFLIRRSEKWKISTRTRAI